MKERPILFSAPMVRAILAGQKTQTRRIVKPQPGPGYIGHFGPGLPFVRTEKGDVRCPYGQPGDRLWVKETWSTHAFLDDTRPSEITTRSLHYWADGDIKTGKKRPSIFMPRWASRILLEIVSIRVEEIQKISPDDAVAEGIERTVTGDGWRRYADPKTEAAGLPPCQYPRHSYRSLWDHINGENSWDANPWVWVVEFKLMPEGDSNG